MANFYEYLMASLPMLHFGMRPPFPFERFLAVAAEFIPERDLAALKKAPLIGDYVSEDDPAALKAWHSFDTALRNELAKIRASRKKVDSSQYIHKDGYVWTQSDAHLAINAYRSHSPIEGERLLDQERWRYIDEMSTGHFFDLESLLAYALKLLILERWERIRSADKEGLLEAALAKG